jgi:hypothetical protein
MSWQWGGGVAVGLASVKEGRGGHQWPASDID